MTVLGSCVAVCLWDSKNCVAGMNHYLLPLWNGEGFKSLKYGNISILKLVDEMILKGAVKHNLVAKIFGGASINLAKTTFCVGEQNIRIAEHILSDLKIPIVARDVGGTKGRKVVISSIDGSVYVKTSMN
ncbi:chemotaxis protein CheD [bacterium]|nr:chemotaxis protein CheD [bacterium]MBU1882877.1 chemotaxis protein CheD [bacterium]